MVLWCLRESSIGLSVGIQSLKSSCDMTFSRLKGINPISQKNCLFAFGTEFRPKFSVKNEKEVGLGDVVNVVMDKASRLICCTVTSTHCKFQHLMAGLGDVSVES